MLQPGTRNSILAEHAVVDRAGLNDTHYALCPMKEETSMNIWRSPFVYLDTCSIHAQHVGEKAFN